VLLGLGAVGSGLGEEYRLFWVQAADIALMVNVLRARSGQTRWLAAARRLLADQSWRPVPVVVSRGGPLVELADQPAGHLVRVTWPRAVRLVAARTGRVWVVGPDAAGWLALRVDGAPTLFRARRIRSGAVVAAMRPEPAGTSGTAADDPVTSAVAARIRAEPHRQLLMGVLVVAALFGFTLLAARSVAAIWITAFVCLPLLVVLAVLVSRQWAGRALPALLRSGPWRQARVTLRPWQLRRDGTATVNGTVTVDGVSLEIVLPRARPDLLGVMWETGTVWLAGDPGRGRVAVGFPGYPLLGVAWLS